MYGVNPVHELQKVLSQPGEASVSDQPKPAPAPKRLTVAEATKDLDKLTDRLLLDSLNLLVADGKSVPQAVKQLFTPKPASKPRPKRAPTEAEMDAAGIPHRSLRRLRENPITGRVEYAD